MIIKAEVWNAHQNLTVYGPVVGLLVDTMPTVKWMVFKGYVNQSGNQVLLGFDRQLIGQVLLTSKTFSEYHDTGEWELQMWNGSVYRVRNLSDGGVDDVHQISNKSELVWVRVTDKERAFEAKEGQMYVMSRHAVKALGIDCEKQDWHCGHLWVPQKEE